MTYLITDWANNLPYGYLEFKSFDDAWERLMIDNPEEQDLGDFYVMLTSEYEEN